jgi:hypothetical protein
VSGSLDVYAGYGGDHPSCSIMSSSATWSESWAPSRKVHAPPPWSPPRGWSCREYRRSISGPSRQCAVSGGDHALQHARVRDLRGHG